jgi:hypothetical protein
MIKKQTNVRLRILALRWIAFIAALTADSTVHRPGSRRVTHSKLTRHRLKTSENAGKMSVKKTSDQTDSSFGGFLVTPSQKCIDFLISDWAGQGIQIRITLLLGF